MLTIFATPRAFRGHIGAIQRDAIRSWTLLRPRPEIILIGDDEGTEEISAEYGLRWIAQVERNEYGTPLAGAVFALGQGHASHPIVCYTSADIVYGNSLLDAVRRCMELCQNQLFLLIGGRWNVERIPPETFERLDWEAELKALLANSAFFDGRIAMDYFVFPKTIAWSFPPFTIGRAGWDSWLPYQACKRGMPVVDIGHVVTAVHQHHDHKPFYAGKLATYDHAPEVQRNLELLGIRGRYWIEDARYQLAPTGGLVEPRYPRMRYFRQRLFAVKSWLVYQLQLRCWPLFVLLRIVRRASRAAWSSVGAGKPVKKLGL